jgi:Tfp pilus assembly protein PilO
MFLYMPTKRRSGILSDQAHQIQLQLEDYRRTIARIPEFLAQSDSLRRSRLLMESSLYAKADILDLLARTERMADARGMRITEIAPSVPELLALNRTAMDPAEPLFLTIHFHLSGNYVGFGKFVQDMEEANFFRGIDMCRIVRPNRSKAEASYIVGVRTLLGSPEGRS